LNVVWRPCALSVGKTGDAGDRVANARGYRAVQVSANDRSAITAY
jgi:hypothetical protein